MKIDPIDVPTYLALLERFDEPSVFNSPKWVALYGDRLTCYAVRGKGDNVHALFYLYRSRRLGLPALTSPPGTPHCGLVFNRRAGSRHKQNDHLKDITQAIATFLGAQRSAVTIVPFPPALTDTQWFSWAGFKVAPFFTYVIALAPPFEQILGEMDSRKRSTLVKADKEGLECELTFDYGVVKDLVLKTPSTRERTLDVDLLDRMLFEFADKENSFAYVAYHRGAPSATVLCVYDGTTAYHLLAGTDPANRHNLAGTLALLHCIRRSKDTGLRAFDFEGSSLPDIERYFRDFGGVLTPYYSVHRAPLPVEMGLKLFRRDRF
jgi:hypothetical protein